MKYLTVILLLCLASCKTWELGDTYTQHIKAGEHYAKPINLEFTKMWGGLCTLEYDSDEMADTGRTQND